MCATGVRHRWPVLFVTARRLKTLVAQSCHQWHTEKSSQGLNSPDFSSSFLTTGPVPQASRRPPATRVENPWRIRKNMR
jgi:hypothetical protein